MTDASLIPFGDELIRPLTEHEAPRLIALYRDCFPEKRISDTLQESLAREPATVWVCADAGETLCGFLYFWTVSDEFQIIDIGVTPARRRHGIAKLFLDKLRALAAARNRSITLEVRSDNSAAIALYESNGFTRDGLRKSYYAGGEDALLYRWRGHGTISSS